MWLMLARVVPLWAPKCHSKTSATLKEAPSISLPGRRAHIRMTSIRRSWTCLMCLEMSSSEPCRSRSRSWAQPRATATLRKNATKFHSLLSRSKTAMRMMMKRPSMEPQTVVTRQKWPTKMVASLRQLLRKERERRITKSLLQLASSRPSMLVSIRKRFQM